MSEELEKRIEKLENLIEKLIFNGLEIPKLGEKYYYKVKDNYEEFDKTWEDDFMDRSRLINGEIKYILRE